MKSGAWTEVEQGPAVRSLSTYYLRIQTVRGIKYHTPPLQRLNRDGGDDGGSTHL
jgi:hypothetical protein